MDKRRIEEIMNSTGMINVTYNNRPIWIEGISTDDDGMVMVSDLDTKRKFPVDIKDLKE